MENSVFASTDGSIATSENTTPTFSTKSSTTWIASSVAKTKRMLCEKRNCVLQNYSLIWLDPSIDESSDEYDKLFGTLSQTVINTYIFTDADETIDFITSNDNGKALMILSGNYVQYLIPLIHDLSQLDAIFIFANNEALDEQLTNNWFKLKGVIKDIDIISGSLKQLARLHEQNSIPISFLTPSKDKTLNDLNQLDPSFMYTRILAQILFELDYGEKSIKELMDYIRKADISTDVTLSMIEQDYHNHPPIWWYTSDYFFYSVLNQALRTLDTATLIKMGFFIRDLHQQIKQLHQEQYGDKNTTHFTLYRGQAMSQVDFQKLNATKSGLISFNNFLSTSEDIGVSTAYAESNANSPDMIGTIYCLK